MLAMWLCTNVGYVGYAEQPAVLSAAPSLAVTETHLHTCTQGWVVRSPTSIIELEFHRTVREFYKSGSTFYPPLQNWAGAPLL